jgi:hypothetical protein
MRAALRGRGVRGAGGDLPVQLKGLSGEPLPADRAYPLVLVCGTSASAGTHCGGCRAAVGD